LVICFINLQFFPEINTLALRDELLSCLCRTPTSYRHRRTWSVTWVATFLSALNKSSQLLFYIITYFGTKNSIWIFWGEDWAFRRAGHGMPRDWSGVAFGWLSKLSSLLTVSIFIPRSLHIKASSRKTGLVVEAKWRSGPDFISLFYYTLLLTPFHHPVIRLVILSCTLSLFLFMPAFLL
jgi:hypothetical protein